MFMSSSAEVQVRTVDIVHSLVSNCNHGVVCDTQVACAKALASVSSTLSAPLHVSGHREDLVKSFIDRVMQGETLQ